MSLLSWLLAHFTTIKVPAYETSKAAKHKKTEELERVLAD
jgi:hypothetical protein